MGSEDKVVFMSVPSLSINLVYFFPFTFIGTQIFLFGAWLWRVTKGFGHNHDTSNHC